MLGEVIEVQDRLVQHRQTHPHLAAEPLGPVGHRELLVGLVQVDLPRLATQLPPELLMVAPGREGIESLLAGIVEQPDLELLPALVGPAMTRHATANLAPPTHVRAAVQFGLGPLEVAHGVGGGGGLSPDRDHCYDWPAPDAVEVGVRLRLEQQFLATLGRTPGAEIRRTHVQLAKELLARTDLSMGEVARRSGFTNAARLSVVFRRITGLTPSAFRRQGRLA